MSCQKKKIPQIVDIMPNGIFRTMANLDGVTLPWEENNALLDIDYIYRWSGYKSISPLVRHLLGNKSEFDASAYETLAGIIWAHYGTPWTKKYEVLVADYDPLENYNMIEHEDNEIVDDALTNVSGSAVNNTNNISSTTSVYGYNSSSATPSESESVSSGTNTDLDTNYDNTRTIERDLTRHGNIGVTTSQMMARSTLELYVYRFFEEVYKDIDRLCALPIYDGEITTSIYQPVQSGGGSGAVDSVNGKTGNVVLYGSDIDLTSLISTTVAQAITNLNNEKRNKPVILSDTLLAGDTTISFTNSAIGDNSFIDVYFNVPSVNMINWTQVGTTFTAYFDAMESNVLVTLEVFN